jgi:hypothetical protein
MTDRQTKSDGQMDVEEDEDEGLEGIQLMMALIIQYTQYSVTQHSLTASVK